MPELPDVEMFRNHFDQTSLNEVVAEVDIIDDYILKMKKDKFRDIIRGKTFQASRRHGKYLFIELNEGNLMLHFGMSGNLQHFQKKGEKPKYSKIIFQFESGNFLSVISVRKLGKVKIITDIDEYVQNKKLGPDALRIKEENFLNQMNDKRSYLKTALMDQETICGIGNIYSDEILFQAKVYPKKKINKLSNSDLANLHGHTHNVLEIAVKRLTDNKELPKHFLIPHREKGERCPQCKGGIQRFEISGRHGYYCPNCQKK